MSKIIIVDGNSLLFRAFFATYMDPSNIMRNSQGTPTNAIFAFSNMIASLLSSVKEGDGFFVGFDAGKHTFRHQQYPEYKANRPKLPEDLGIQMPIAREFLDALNIVHFETDNLEADDICGIMAKKAAKLGYDVQIYTSDKDYLQLIDDKITIELIKKGLKDIHEMTPQSFKEERGFEPIQITDYKGLRGDDSDNLKGIPGVGDKTAKQLISLFGDLESIIQNANTTSKVGRNIIEFQEQGRVCKQLAIIATNESIPLEVKDIIYNGYEFQKISAFATKYEFRNLINKLPKVKKKVVEIAKIVEFCEVSSSKDIKIGEWISLGIDESNDNYHKANLYGISIRTESGTYYINRENLLKDEALINALKNPNIKKYCFDYKKIWIVLKNAGIEIQGLYFDLLLANYLLDSSATSSELFPTLNMYSIDTTPAENVESLFDDGNQKRAAYGAFYAYELSEKVIADLKEKDQLSLLYDIEQPLTIVLADMEYEGFPIDRDTLLEFKADYQQKISALTTLIYECAGEEFNINSPKQVGTILYEKLGLKGPKNKSTSVDALANIIDEHPIVPLILEYRKYAKLVSTYIDGFIPFIDESGKIHPTFNQALTSTGRLSCSEPNLQNITTRDEEGKKIRKAFFYKDPDLNILSLDYSQIELRILAHLSNSETLIRVFNNNEDIHTETAKKVFNLGGQNPTPDQRRHAKAVNFGIIYGISDWGLSEQLGISIIESRNIIKSFYASFPEIRNYLDSLIADATAKGYAETMFNRKRYLPDINSSQYNLREFAKRAAMNAPIQGSAADLIKIAMIQVYKALKDGGYKAKIVSQIHDELIIKVNDKEKDDVYKLVKDIMENCVKLNVKLDVEGGYAKNWFLAK